MLEVVGMDLAGKRAQLGNGKGHPDPWTLQAPFSYYMGQGAKLLKLPQITGDCSLQHSV